MDIHDAAAPGMPGGPSTCSVCGNTGLERGFVEDSGEGARGYARWVVGALERGFFGGARLMGRTHMEIEGYRCPACGHLDLYAHQQD